MSIRIEGDVHCTLHHLLMGYLIYHSWRLERSSLILTFKFCQDWMHTIQGQLFSIISSWILNNLAVNISHKSFLQCSIGSTISWIILTLLLRFLPHWLRLESQLKKCQCRFWEDLIGPAPGISFPYFIIFINLLNLPQRWIYLACKMNKKKNNPV